MVSALRAGYRTAAASLVDSLADVGVHIEEGQAEDLIRVNVEADAALKEAPRTIELARVIDVPSELADKLLRGMLARPLDRRRRRRRSSIAWAAAWSIYSLAVVDVAISDTQQANRWLLGICALGTLAATLQWLLFESVIEPGHRRTLLAVLDRWSGPLSYSYAIGAGYAVGFYIDHKSSDPLASDYLVILIAVAMIGWRRHCTMRALSALEIDRYRWIENDLFSLRCRGWARPGGPRELL